MRLKHEVAYQTNLVLVSNSRLYLWLLKRLNVFVRKQPLVRAERRDVGRVLKHRKDTRRNMALTANGKVWLS